MNCKCKDKGNYCVNRCETAVETVETAETVEHIGFDDWISDMEEQEQPEQCSIDNPDCENCGS